jgi:uncharacterized protein YjiS (DUF1127 family)
MTTVTNTHSVSHSLGLIAAPLRLVHSVGRRIRQRREMNRLLSFPDYLLKDVGVQRHDIQRQAVRSLWHE